MHAYFIKYACIFILTFVKHRHSTKKNKYACMYNKHAQNYTKYAQNGAFTNGTQQDNTKLVFNCLTLQKASTSYKTKVSKQVIDC